MKNKNGAFSTIKKVFKAFSLVVLLVFKLIFFIFKTLFYFLALIKKGLGNKLRFSLSFRITITYVFLFFFIFLLMSIGIILSFDYYVKYYPPGDYVFLLGGILLVFNAIGIFFITFIGSRASRRLLSPIKAMTRTVQEISFNQLDRRLDVSGSKNELKELAQTFNAMLDRIQKSVEQQTRFVSDASHELRTPISVIRGYANLLSRWGRDDKKVLDESISAILSEAESMNHLIEELLFLARGDNRALKVNKEEFQLCEVINEILQETRLIDTTHQIINERNEEFVIMADRKLLKEAIRIFVDNSTRYTPPGGVIKLNCYLSRQNAVISVEDTGIGISKEDLPHIFNRFYRAERSRTKESGGTGLGLTIAKLIIDSHNGRINVWSEINEGTIFRIQLPLS
ncbi:MAG: ATP-binding protein [Peptococcaceae bacterium]|jgi:signal transduction histidine kinase|nr:ATP-binding protein [Peptococcaceae bacterium]MDH7524577.1 ATP-binding protein [Peptococcaceae bacterium]